MERLLSIYLEDKSPNNKEFEVRFGTKDKSITKINYDGVIKKLLSLGFTFDSTNPETRLRITLDKKSIRCDINGIENISQYCKSNMLGKLNPNSFKFVDKKYLKDANGEIIPPVDNDDFSFRTSLQSEDEIDSLEIQERIFAEWKNTKKLFRYISRLSLTHKNYPYIRVDLTIVKNSHTTTGKFNRYIPEYTIENADVFAQPEHHEIEIEVLQTDESGKNVLANLKKTIKHVLSGIQESNYPIGLREQNIALLNYMNLIERKKPLVRKDIKEEAMNHAKKITKDRGFSKNFIGPSQVTLQLHNIATENKGEININEDYTVTEKADGLRKLLFIDDVGKIYLINTSMKFQYSGMKTEEKSCFNTLIDGEHILYDKKKQYINVYKAFDIYFMNSEDQRSLPLHIKEAGAKTRYSNLLKFIRLLKVSIKNETSSVINYLRIEAKTFYLVDKNSPSIFAHCNKILSDVDSGLYEYETDGLIFTPALIPVGQNAKGDPIENKKKTWMHCMKWKPPEFNTNDFLVTTVKNEQGYDSISDIVETGQNLSDQNQRIKYKTLTLRCGFRSKILNPCQDVIDDNIIIRNPKESYKPAAFYPTNPTDDEAHICNIKLVKDSNGTYQMMTEEGEVFTDKTIVEFKYVMENKSKWRWIPIRVRYDKTALYLAGETVYGNDYEVANNNWKTIHEPITENMLRTGEDIPTNIESSVYYNRGKKKSKTQAMRDFHNKYIKSKLISSVSNPGNTLIDFAVGKAGDIAKWRSSKLSFILGVDISEDNIENKQDGACVRFIEDYNKFKTDLRALFIIGNSIYNFKTGEGLRSQKDKIIYNAVVGVGPNSEKQLGKGVKAQYGKAINGFDIASCQFALHYFFEDQVSLKGFMQNLSENTKVGGYFVGTCYDGSKIFNQFQTMSKGESIIINEDGETLLEITKQYDNTTFNNDSSCIGYAIDVLAETINKKFREYLVNFNYLTRILENYGFVKLTESECNDIDMPSSVGNFSSLHKKMLHEIKSSKGTKRYGNADNMSSNEMQISFMNKYFIFKKIKTVDTKAVVLDVAETDINDDFDDEPVIKLKKK